MLLGAHAIPMRGRAHTYTHIHTHTESHPATHAAAHAATHVQNTTTSDINTLSRVRIFKLDRLLDAARRVGVWRGVVCLGLSTSRSLPAVAAAAAAAALRLAALRLAARRRRLRSSLHTERTHYASRITGTAA